MNANTPTGLVLGTGLEIPINTFNTSPQQNFSPFQFKPFNEQSPKYDAASH